MINIWNRDFEWIKTDTYTDKVLSNYAKTGKIWDTVSGTTYGVNLPSNNITSFYDLKIDTEWYIGTDSGIYVYNYNTLSGYTINTDFIVENSGLTSNNIYSLTIDEFNKILYVTTDENIWQLDLKTNYGKIIIPSDYDLDGDYPPNSGITNPSCNIICYKNDQELTLLYFGFSSNGIWEFSYDENIGKIINTSTPVTFGSKLPNNNILHMSIDTLNDTLYVATSTVLWSKTRTTNNGFNWDNFIPEAGYYQYPIGSASRCVLYDNIYKILYVGFENDGIWYYDFNTKYGDIYDTTAGVGLPSNSIYYLEKDYNKNIIYAGTKSTGTGIWSYDIVNGFIKRFTTTSGVTYGYNLPSNQISCIIKNDEDNILYGGTNAGLWKFNYEAQYVDVILDGLINKVERNQYYETDNINDVYFKLQKAFSGISYTYTDNLEDIYKYDLMMGSKYYFENFFNEYDIIDKHLTNFHIVDIASVSNIDLSAKTFKIDDILLKTNHLVLLKNQTNTIENDIYQVNEKNYLIRLDYLSTYEKSDRFKVYVKMGTVNKDKQWFLFYKDDKYFPTTYEYKEFIEKHSYIIKHKLIYDIDNIPTYTGNTHKLLFADYDIARKMNNKNYELWTGVTINVTDLFDDYLLYGEFFDIYYYNNLYRIYVDKTDTPFDSFIKTELNAIPIMTSNTLPIGVCSSSGVMDNSNSYQPYKAFDNNINTKWLSNTPDCWIQYKFENPVIIYSYSIYFNEGNNLVGRSPRDWTLTASKDGKTWETLDTRYTITNWKIPNIEKVFNIENNESYIYYRLNIINNNGDINTTAIASLKLFNKILVTGLTSFINYNSSYIYNSGVTNISGFTNISLETAVRYNVFTDIDIHTDLIVGDYIEIEFLRNNLTYSKFKTSIKRIESNYIILNDLIPEWVIQDFANNSTHLKWIIKLIQHATSTANSLITALQNSFLSDYFNVEMINTTDISIKPKENIYNKEFDYDSLMFKYDNIEYKFSTQNSYINYNLYSFLHKILPTLFTEDRIIYNNNTIDNFTFFYLDKDIIQLNIINDSVDILKSSFKPFTYIDITGSTHTGTTLILGITGTTMYIEKPKNFTFHESIISIQNISTLKRISDILYDVYKNINLNNYYYIIKNDYIRKNIYLYYGDILTECAIINFYCLGLLTETKNMDRNFILRMFKLEDDDNLELTIDYRPIEVLDIGIDKKTMIPKPLIYPDYFVYTDRIDDLYYEDYNILDGNEWLIYLVVDNNIISDNVIYNNV